MKQYTKTLLAMIMPIISFVFLINTAMANTGFITVASTTSTENSGLYEYILPIFTEKTEIQVKVIAVGTGNAIKLAENGDADVLLVHHKSSEEEFVAKGFGVERFDLMYNDFVIAGPKDKLDEFQIENNIFSGLAKIKDEQYPFVSRGDDSGTHKKELELWSQIQSGAPDAATDKWYKETGQGMGASLNIAADLNAFILTDRGTWLNFDNKKDLEILIQNDPKLFNYYGIIQVSTEKHPHVKAQQAKIFIDWMLSEEGQAAINSYKIKDQQAFFANASN